MGIETHLQGKLSLPDTNQAQRVLDALGVQDVLQKNGAAAPEMIDVQPVVPDLNLQTLMLCISQVMPTCTSRNVYIATDILEDSYTSSLSYMHGRGRTHMIFSTQALYATQPSSTFLSAQSETPELKIMLHGIAGQLAMSQMKACGVSGTLRM